MHRTQVDIPEDKIAEFCKRWMIVEFALFGSVLRDDFRPDSDVDVLVTFADDAHWSLADLVAMQDELTGIFGREVDLVEEAALKNPFRRHAIVTSKEIVHVAR